MKRNWRVVVLGLLAVCLTNAIKPAEADELYLVNGEQITCEWQSATDQAVTVLPTGEDQSPREVPLMDIDRVQLADREAVKPEPVKPLIDNDGGHAMVAKKGTIKLRKGLHRFTLLYVQGSSEFGLTMNVMDPNNVVREMAGPLLHHVPDGGKQPLPQGTDDQGFRLPEDPSQIAEQVRYTYHTNSAEQRGFLTNVRHLADMDVQAEGLTDRISVDLKQHDVKFGFIFTGYLMVELDGEYTFTLTSDDGSQFFFGPGPDYLQNTTPFDPEAPVGDWRVSLSDGYQVIGKPVGWDDAGLTLQANQGDRPFTITLPSDQITQMIAGQTPTETDEAQPDELDTSDASADQDTVYVASESGKVQRVSGMVLGIEGDAIAFRFQEADRKIKLNKIRGLVLAGRDGVSGSSGFHQAFILKAGHRIPGTLKTSDSTDVRLETVWGEHLEIPVTEVTSIQSRNGRLVYVSDLTPRRVEQTAYFDRVIPYRSDLAANGTPIKLIGSDDEYERGISTHARTVLQYELAKNYNAFKCTLGLQDGIGRLGDAHVRVLGDGEVLFELASLKAEAGPQILDLDVSDVDVLTLETDFGAGQDVGDHVGWAGARLFRDDVSP